MFLNRLNDQEKNSFIQLAHHLAHSDGSVAQQEEDVIAKYCMEMQIDDIEYSEGAFNLDEVLKIFKADSHKKIVLLEIMALVFADGILDDAEQEVINQIIDAFKLNPNLAIVYKEWAKSILSLFVQGEALIHI